MDLNEQLKQLPTKPGVYMMLDSLENIIYVGKAKNLKNRVSQYFRSQKNRAPKVVEMVHNIHRFNYMVTDTELDAFIEECRLIKELKPKYNSQMKNYRNYSYIKIPAEQYPKLAIVNEKKPDGASYLGPFTSLRLVEAAVQYLNDFYPVRKCTSPGLVRRSSGCLFRQLGTCLGACTGQVSPDEYRNYIERIQQLLKGNDMAVLKEIQKRLDEAVESLKFEKAAQYREYYSGLQHVIAKQRLVQSSNRNRNILAVEFIDTELAKLFLIKGNKLLHGEVFNIESSDSTNMMLYLKNIILDKFAAVKNDMGKLTQYDIDEAQIIYSYMKKNKKNIISFWIPSTRLNRGADNINDTVAKIIKGIKSKNLCDDTVIKN